MSSPIGFVQRSGLLVLRVGAQATAEDFTAVPDLLAEQLGAPGSPALSGIVVDLAGSDMNEKAWKEFSANLSAIPGRNRFFIVAVPKDLQALLTQSRGLAGEVLTSIEEVFTKLGNARSHARPTEAPKEKTADDTALEKLLIKTFQAAAIKTFEVQCSVVFKPGTVYLKSAGPKIVHDIAASMGMMSKAVSGSVAMGFKEATFLKIMGRMLGEEYTGITSDVEDGCGELLNIVFGQAKKALSDEGHQFGKTLPAIFAGQSLRVRQLTPNPAFVLPFESELGQMVMELGYRHT